MSTKLAINGTFADVIKASVIPMPARKKVEPKKDSQRRNDFLNSDKMWLLGFFKKDKKLTTSHNTAVFTTKKIMLENEVITRVYHHDDNSFSFMDNYSSNSNANIMVVGLGEILKKDSSIKAILNIPSGYSATRTHIKDKWVVGEFTEES